jgi:hypothetical protein
MMEFRMRTKDTGPAKFLNSMAIARLIRYANSNEPLIELCSLSVKTEIPDFSGEFEDQIQLNCRCQWILAISDLEKRCKELPIELNKQKIALVSVLTLLSISSIKDENSYLVVFRIFREIMDDNLDVAEAILRSFNIPTDTAGMASNLESLRAEVKATIERLQGKK